MSRLRLPGQNADDSCVGARGLCGEPGADHFLVAGSIRNDVVVGSDPSGLMRRVEAEPAYSILAPT